MSAGVLGVSWLFAQGSDKPDPNVPDVEPSVPDVEDLPPIVSLRSLKPSGPLGEVAERRVHATSFPEGMLFHYTLAGGLHGIVKDRELRTTQIQYLNDFKEFVHASELAIKIIEERQRAIKGEGAVLLSVMRHVLRVNDGARTFVFSLSEEPDLLSQWRAYCPGGASALVLCRAILSGWPVPRTSGWCGASMMKGSSGKSCEEL